MLTEDFLAPYRARKDNFPNLLARCTFSSKYSRQGQSWTDTIVRVVNANCDLDPSVAQRERELLFHLFWTMQAMPPGRGLWVGGIPGIPADARYNCFSKETRFWANGCLMSLEEAAGNAVEVLCKDGQWRTAEVKNFGKQKLQRVVLKAPGRSNFAFEFIVTANHRWFTARGEVTDLRVGDKVAVTPADVKKKVSTPAYADGFAHGFVFGDGTKETQKEHTYKARICGQKDKKFVEALKASSFFSGSCSPPSYNGDEVLFFKSDSNLKALPEDHLTDSYHAGFLAGWLAADGSLRSDGRGGNRLASINADALAWVVDRAPLLGFCVTGYSTDPSTETNFGPRSAPLGVLTLTPEVVEYTVRAIIDEGREEDVYCVVEPVTRSFTLEGGVVTGNCWYTTIYDLSDWGWVANMLMLGGGVGVGLEKVHLLPTVASSDMPLLHVTCDPGHPNATEVSPDPHVISHNPFVVPDSREGWVGVLLGTLVNAFEGQSFFVDVSKVRARGEPIKTFGGVACGPGPLVDMIRSVWNTVRGARGRKLSSVEALDITNYIGRCIKSGNVRRSALIALGGAEDQPFRDAKKDWAAVQSHRHTSNNSINFHTFDMFHRFDWRGLVHDNIEFGEPGLNNLALGRLTDPDIEGINPCGEQQLENRESCNLAEIFPALFDGSIPTEQIFRLVTRYTLRQRLSPLSDPKSEEQRKKNMRIGVGLGGLCDFDWTEDVLKSWYKVVREEANSYADSLGVARPITTTTVKPSGTISLLNGSSPGIHAPEAPFYIRRMRVADNEPIVDALVRANVPHELDKYDRTGHTLVFSFPMRSRNQKTSALTQTITEQFERQLAVQRSWADNAVSCTIKFDKDEAGSMAEHLSMYAPQLKSVSMLPKAHAYVQAPYEPIDEDTYVKLSSGIDQSASMMPGAEVDIGDDCAGGVCPIR